MDTFYIIVLTIAAILLILILTYVGLTMRNASASNNSFPPTINSCPDYWASGTDPSSCAIPTYGSKNVGSIYDINNNHALILTSSNTSGFSTANKDIVFSDPGWVAGGSSSICSQKKWANQYGILWDGVSNYNGC